VQALQDHDAVSNVTDAVAAGTEKVFRSRRNEERDGTEVTRIRDLHQPLFNRSTPRKCSKNDDKKFNRFVKFLALTV